MSDNTPLPRTLEFDLTKDFGGRATADLVPGEGYTVILDGRIWREGVRLESLQKAEDFLAKGQPHKAALILRGPI